MVYDRFMALCGPPIFHFWRVMTQVAEHACCVTLLDRQLPAPADAHHEQLATEKGRFNGRAANARIKAAVARCTHLKPLHAHKHRQQEDTEALETCTAQKASAHVIVLAGCAEIVITEDAGMLMHKARHLPAYDLHNYTRLGCRHCANAHMK